MQVPSRPSLEETVRVGEHVVVMDDAGRETRGLVRAVTETALTVDRRIAAANGIDVVRPTDPLPTARGLVWRSGLTSHSRRSFAVGSTTSANSAACASRPLSRVGASAFPYQPSSGERSIGPSATGSRPP